MSNVFLLIKIHYMGAFGLNRALHTKDGREKTKFWGIAAAVVFSFLILLFTFAAYCWFMGVGLQALGMEKMLLAVMMAVSSVLCLMTSVYKGSSVLFNFSDYDLVMPMPLKSFHVVTAKLLILYLMNLAFTLFVMIPAIIVYGILASPSPVFYLLALVLTLFVPMLPILVGTAFSVLINMVASTFRSKNIVAILLSLIAVCGVMMLSFSSGSLTEKMMTNLSLSISSAVYKIYPLTRVYTEAVCGPDFWMALLFIGVSAIVFFVFAFFTGKKFKAMHTFLTTTQARSHYKMGSLKGSGVMSALYKREIRRYFSSTIYVINTIMGAVMLTLMSVVLVFGGQDMLAQITGIPGAASLSGYVMPFIIATLMGMTATTPVSVSLEGKSLSLLKTLPISPMQIYQAKIGVNLTITVPAVLINVPILVAVLKLSAFQTLFCFIIPLAFAFFWAQTGLIINLLLPNFSWTNEVTVVKQSMPTFIGIFGGMLLPLLPLIPLMALPFSRSVMLAVIGVVFILGNIPVYGVLKHWGSRTFIKLSA